MVVQALAVNKMHPLILCGIMTLVGCLAPRKAPTKFMFVIHSKFDFVDPKWLVHNSCVFIHYAL